MSFWGLEIKADKLLPWVPPPDAARLRISQATISIDAAQNERLGLLAKVGEEETLICSLREGSQESVNLDIIFDSYTEFKIVSKKNKKAVGSIHLAGYLIPEEEHDHDHAQCLNDEDEDDSEEEGDEDFDEEQLRALLKSRGIDVEEQDMLDSEEDSEDEDEEDSQLESDEEEAGRKPSVIIEEINEEEAKPLENGNGTIVTQSKIVKASKPSEKEENHKQQEKATANGKVEHPAKEAEESGSDEDDSESEEEEDEEELLAAIEEDMKRKRKAEDERTPAKSTTIESKKDEPSKKKAKTVVSVETPKAETPAPKPLKGIKKFANGFIIENVSMGDPAGKLAKPGKKVVVKYVGKLEKTGKIFDQTKGQKTFSFRLGVGEVIKGWDQGVVGMRVGDKRKLTVPAIMGYGASGIPKVIPGNATLVFDVELVDVKG